jgi:AAA ATPase domain/CHAT domain
MAADRHVQIGHDAPGNVIITGDNGRVYVFPGITALSPAWLAQLDSGALTLQEEPTAVPLPSLILRIAYGDAQRTTWTITSVYPDAQGTSYTVPVPWHTQRDFADTMAGFWELSRRAIEDADELRAIHHQALTLGEALGTVLALADRQLLETRARDDGPPPLLIIESADEAALSLPWELLRLQGRYAVHDGRLDVARCVPAPGAPHLARPTAPVTLLVNISAPEQSGLDYEAESYSITRALHDHVGVVVNEMGELDDLVTGLRGEPPPLGVHFSGHGGRGQLVFEDEFGGTRTVLVEEMLNTIRRGAPERMPRFFYLASCHGGDAPALSGDGASMQSGLPATATALHREGVAQVVAYFGPVYDRQSTLAETAFYTEIARGRRTRDAARAARLAMARPFLPLEREAARDNSVQSPDGTTPFSWAQLVFYHRGPDYPLGTLVPPKYSMTVEAPPAREEEPVFVSGRSYVLHKGFIGRRRELHALRRDLHRGQNVHVVQGLGGLGKTAFCYEALKLYKRQGRDVLTLWCAEVEQEGDPVSALMRQLSEQATTLIREAWEAIVAAVDHLATQQLAVQRPSIRLITLLRVLLRQPEQPPLVLYLDNLESLLNRPDDDDGDALRAWRDPEAETFWRELVQMAQTSGGRLALLASCRYRQSDFDSGLIPFSRLPDDAVWRMLGWFPSLRRLSAVSRTHLVTQLAGHPRAVTWLDALVSYGILQWEELHGPLPKAAYYGTSAGGVGDTCGSCLAIINAADV